MVHSAVGLFAGIGGFELGFRKAGVRTRLLCENDPAARLVLERRFPGIEITGDIRDLSSLPESEFLAAGFPCTDLSQAGRTAGISGSQSGLVDHVFRLLEGASSRTTVVLENVPFMLALAGGAAMTHIVERLEHLGMDWAYRTVDTMSFGLPQRRRRVLLVASMVLDPASVLFPDDYGHPPTLGAFRMGGFYWTEGRRGLGWTREGLPPLKVSSGIGIASPPAIWDSRTNHFFTPDIRDAEALQGFPRGWTEVVQPERARWKLVGNAVTVPVSAWLGRRLLQPGDYPHDHERPLIAGHKWPSAARGGAEGRFEVATTPWPVQRNYRPLSTFLRGEAKPLSERAASGFLSRALTSSLHFEDGFLDALAGYIAELGTSCESSVKT